MVNYEFLRHKLVKLAKTLPCCAIRYEYDDSMKEHLVEIVDTTGDYSKCIMDFRINIRNSMYNLYPDDTIMFVSKESLNKISGKNIIFEYNY